MYRVTVKSDQVNVKAGVSARTQKPYRITEQEAYIQLIDPKTGTPRPFPERFVLNIEDGQQPYPPGDYTLDPGVVYVDRFGGLSVGRVKLVPLARPAAVPSSGKPAAA